MSAADELYTAAEAVELLLNRPGLPFRRVADTLPPDTVSAVVAGLAPVTLAQLDMDLRTVAARREHDGLLAEQRHQFLDLDVDSVCPIAGASLYPYLPAGGAS
jgi:hypothetical protein